MTPLHKACQYGAIRAVEELVKEGADVLYQNDVSPSPAYAYRLLIQTPVRTSAASAAWFRRGSGPRVGGGAPSIWTRA